MRAPDKAENTFAAVLFCTALLFHAWGARAGWTSLNLPGCEFRQAQTAISAFFIQRENNFSLSYPTPVLGKPWSIPLEFPLYQWSVAALSNATGMSLTSAGRAVSLACFYALLPALCLLLARLGLPRSRRLVALSLVLCCPLYIFYARAFLIETMAAMFSAWFLLAYVRAVEERSPGWWLAASLTGVAAGLVKVTTLLLFLMPAFVWTLVWLWQDLGGTSRWRRLATRIWWSGTAVLLPCAAAIWWVQYADGIKALSPAGSFLQSASMAGYNFGFGARWSADIWRQHWVIYMRDLTSVPVLVLGGIIAVVFARRWWALIVALLVFFLLVQVVFPILYAWHEYYYVANTMMLMLALGLALVGLLESRAPRWAAWGLIVLMAGGEAWGYLAHHYPGQKRYSPGGTPLTVALKAVTDPDDVIVIAGNDWSSITPYFAQRRSLMIRRNLETTWDLIHPAFKALAGEPVTALVLHGEQRGNRMLLQIARDYFGLSPQPAFHWDDATVYLHPNLWLDAAAILDKIPGITPAAGSEKEIERFSRREITMDSVLPRTRHRFFRMHPQPWKYYTTFGAGLTELEGQKYYSAHPDTRLWFKAGPGDHRMTIEVMMLPAAYDEKLAWGDRSDGIEVSVTTHEAGTGARRVLTKEINPRNHPEHRGWQRLSVDFNLTETADVELAVTGGPAGSISRDWTFLGDVRIQ